MSAQTQTQNLEQLTQENGLPRHTNSFLDEMEILILKKIKEAKKEAIYLRSLLKNENGTDDTSPVFKSFEEGSETMSKEQNEKFAVRQERFAFDLENALNRVKSKTYGVCCLTGELMPEEMMRLTPHRTKSVIAKKLSN